MVILVNLYLLGKKSDGVFIFHYLKNMTDPCESQPHKGHLGSKLNSKTVSVLPTSDPSHVFPIHLRPFPVHPTGLSFCFFPGFLTIFVLFHRTTARSLNILVLRSKTNPGGVRTKPLMEIDSYGELFEM